MDDNEAISPPEEDTTKSVFWPPVLEDRVMLTTSGPARDALEKQTETDVDEREMIWDLRYLGRWVFKNE